MLEEKEVDVNVKEISERAETLGEKLFREEAEAAERHYLETGIYFTQEEVNEWFDSLEKGIYKPRPVWKGK
ncbi:MAG: hypothetical protein IJ566_06490 [Cardiobacteriaceae bacterium]|nr:hypothetical protein [Cardiobacteriaceae bacterium]